MDKLQLADFGLQAACIIGTVIAVFLNEVTHRKIDRSLEEQKFLIEQMESTLTHLRWQCGDMEDYLMRISLMRRQMENHDDVTFALDHEIERVKGMGVKLPWEKVA